MTEPKKMQGEIYNRFTQVVDTFTRENEGSGIGLSLVKSFVELHNGNISLSSEPDKGSNFIVSLPDRVLDSNEHNSLVREEISFRKLEIEFSDLNV